MVMSLKVCISHKTFPPFPADRLPSRPRRVHIFRLISSFYSSPVPQLGCHSQSSISLEKYIYFPVLPPLARAVKPFQYRCHSAVRPSCLTFLIHSKKLQDATHALHHPSYIIHSLTPLLNHSAFRPLVISHIPHLHIIHLAYSLTVFSNTPLAPKIIHIPVTSTLTLRHTKLRRSLSLISIRFNLITLLFILPFFGLIYFYCYAIIRPSHIHIMGRHLHPRGMRTSAQPGPKIRIHQIESSRSVRFESFSPFFF